MDAATSKLLALHEIGQILATYSIAIDTRRPDLLDRCFEAAAQLHLDGLGALDLEQYKDLCRTTLPTLDATQHFLGAPAILVEGDRALSRCYFVAQHVRNALAPRPALLVGGWYDDELARGAGGWRICRRRGTAVWYDGNPDVLGYPFPMGASPRGPGHEAPVWLAR
jgi:hypothetical protein